MGSSGGVASCQFSHFFTINSYSVLGVFWGVSNLPDTLKKNFMGRGTWRVFLSVFYCQISVTNLMNFDIGENCPNFVQIEENVHPKMAITSADLSKKCSFSHFFLPQETHRE